MRLENRSIIVTGAGRGIGAASARHFAAEGARLLLVARTGADLEAVAGPLRQSGADVVTCAADVTDPGACVGAARQAADAFGRIDGLFNNAGQLIDGDAGLLETSFETWKRTLEANLDSVFLMSRAVVPYLVEAGGGAIVNNASMVAHIGSASAQTAYCASKGGVVALSREMAVEFASKNIRVNAVSPGPVATDLFHGTIGSTPGFMERRLPHMPMKRLGEALEIATIAGFLLSEEASYLTGQSILVDGGITAAYTT